MRKGAYILFLTFRRPCTINAGALGPLTIGEGEYCYVGSAMNGLDSRISRHLSKQKKIRWHIDHLTMAADGTEAFISTEIKECELARAAEDSGCKPVFKGFGSSDCRCATHLFLTSTDSKEELLRASAVLPFS
ncbi:MAG: GIY-YIG nuclease family protein [Methanomassiliicoccaceae archaeon]|jgi:Uri superfamily endonuclease|nr:GIY-YIG nuclease family protein [Methanomassiliicoccaceae archaeon]